MSKATDCGQLPFKTAEANAKAWMRSEGFINGALYITAAPEEKEKEFERIAEALKKRGKEKYGITADWIQMAGDGFIVVNRAAFKACDMLNGLYYKNNVNGYPYYRQVVKYKPKTKKKGPDNQGEIEFNDEEMDPEKFFFPKEDEGLYTESTAGSTYVPSSGLTKLIAMKKKLLINAQAQLGRVENLMKINRGNKKISQDLHVEAQKLRDYIEGTDPVKDPGRMNPGLKREIAELEFDITNYDPAHYASYIESMLRRLDSLIDSELTYELGEAREIIEFIIAMNNFDLEQLTTAGMGHPIYDLRELSEMNEEEKDNLDLLREEYFSIWAAKALEMKNKLFLSEKRAIEKMVNEDKMVKKLFGDKKFTYEEIVKTGMGMQDINWLDMMLMDITAGIFSHNGMLPQITMKFFKDFLGKAMVEQRLLESALEKVVGPAEKALMELDNGDHRLAGFLGAKGVSWSIFWQRDKDGHPKPILIHKFSSEWDLAASEATKRYYKDFDAAKTSVGQGYFEGLKKAYKRFNKWLRENTILVNPAYLPELWEDNEENDGLQSIRGFFPQSEEEKRKAEEHKRELIDQVGEKYYRNLVEQQREKLLEYITQRDLALHMIRFRLGELSEDFKEEDLDDEVQEELKKFDAQYNPFLSAKFLHDKDSKGEYKDRGSYYSEITDKKTNKTTIEYDYYSYYTYNLKVPLRNKGGKPTDYYDRNYGKIENNQALLDFYEVAKAGLSAIRSKFDLDTQKNIPARTIFFQEQTVEEKIFQKSKMDPSYKLADKIKEGLTSVFDYLKTRMGVKVEDTMNLAPVNTITGLPEYHINDSFIKQGIHRLNALFDINAMEFSQKYRQITGKELKSLNKGTHLKISPETAPILAVLISPYMGRSITEAEMIARFGDRLPVGRILTDHSQHQLVQEQSYDLPKILRYFGHAAAEYSARNESLPFVSFLKRHYENIRDVRTNNINQPIKNAITGGGAQLDGLRTKAIRQHDAWFNRVILGDYSLRKHFGVANPPEDKETKAQNIARRISDTMHNRGIGRKMLTSRELEIRERLDAMIVKETNPDALKKLKDMKDDLGRTVTVSAILDALADFLRFKGLGYNLSSGITNLMEGQMANALAASMGTWFPTQYIDTITLTEIIASDFRKRMTKKRNTES